MIRIHTTSDDDLGHLVNHLARIMRQKMGRACADLGLTAPQAAVLLTLSEGPLTISGAGDRLGMDRPTMSGLAERLVRDGWAELAPNPTDRRSKLLQLTDRGHAALPGVIEAAHSVNAEVTRPLDRAEREHLLALLQRLAAGSASETHDGNTR